MHAPTIGKRPAGRLPLLSLLAAPLLMVSCDASSAFGRAGLHHLVVVLPALPPAWEPLQGLRFRLSWRGAGGCAHELFAEAGSASEIEVERGSFQALLAEPRLEGRSLMPAGALYPADVEGPIFGPPTSQDRVELTWLGGYVAATARALEEADLDAGSFNLLRLREEAGDRVSDPWLLGAREAARRLAEGSFRADLFREPPRFEVCLPGPGPWAPESPFAPAPEPSAEGWTAWLPAGTSFYRGSSLDLLVSVDESGSASWVRLFQSPPD